MFIKWNLIEYESFESNREMFYYWGRGGPGVAQQYFRRLVFVYRLSFTTQLIEASSKFAFIKKIVYTETSETYCNVEDIGLKPVVLSGRGGV